MLTVKVYDETGVRAGYECASYTYHPTYHGLPGEQVEMPAIILMDDDGDTRMVLRPTDATIYVMNDAGKTIDTLKFGPNQPPNHPPPRPAA